MLDARYEQKQKKKKKKKKKKHLNHRVHRGKASRINSELTGHPWERIAEITIYVHPCRSSR